jgi:hypothetical protein
MAQPVGRRLALSPARRFINDMMGFAQRVPLITVQRVMQLGPVAEARARCEPRLGWCTLFTKAYALAAVKHRPLRWAYIPFPWPHFYEHPHNVASVAVERCLGGEDAVLFCHLRGPENQNLIAIQKHLARCKQAPIETIALYRRILKMSRWPRPVRHLLWWLGLDTSGYRRACHVGTFGVSAVAGLGSTLLSWPTPVTTCLNYGVLRKDRSLEVQLRCDHRVLDAGTAARALAEVERILKEQILNELDGLQKFGGGSSASGFRARSVKQPQRR